MRVEIDGDWVKFFMRTYSLHPEIEVSEELSDSNKTGLHLYIHNLDVFTGLTVLDSNGGYTITIDDIKELISNKKNN